MGAEAPAVAVPGSGQVFRSHVGGAFIDGSGATFETRNPATGALLGVVEIAGPDTVEAAVAAAVAGQKVWARMTGTERGRVLKRAADLLRAANAELAELETRDTGKPIQETLAVDVMSGADCLDAEGNGEVGLAGAGRPEQVQHLVAADEIELRQGEDAVAVE